MKRQRGRTAKELHTIDKAAFHDMLRFLPGAATVAMIFIIGLQISGHLNGWLGAVDIVALFAVSVAARLGLRRFNST